MALPRTLPSIPRGQSMLKGEICQFQKCFQWPRLSHSHRLRWTSQVSLVLSSHPKMLTSSSFIISGRNEKNIDTYKYKYNIIYNIIYIYTLIIKINYIYRERDHQSALDCVVHATNKPLLRMVCVWLIIIIEKKQWQNWLWINVLSSCKLKLYMYIDR